MRPLAVIAVAALCTAAIGASPTGNVLRGFTFASSSRERLIEAQFSDVPSAQHALDVATAIGARPHYAGTAGDYALALYARDALREDGISADLQAFSVSVDSPRELVLELAPADLDPPGKKRLIHKRVDTGYPVSLALNEIGDPSDPATTATGIGLPFNSGSGDGDIRAPLVFANRGLDPDYATLAQANVDVRGAVVLLRYGAQFRGLLAARAQAHGAAGVLFYSDPKDDGSARGLVYPNGPWRPPNAIQRGSVGTDIHIPTLPISATNAQILLGSLRGVSGPVSWGGALPVTYPLARGPGRVHLIVKLTRQVRTLWNTIGIIPGSRNDQSVILGAHRDAWVYGVGDNGAGVTTMLELARGLGFVSKGGWHPQRTIVIALWDGEEIGLAGSHAYAQAHRIEIERGCVGYLNADENVTGAHVSAAAVAALAPLVVDASHDVTDPLAPAGTIYDRWTTQSASLASGVDMPGGGSDHEAFLYGAGTPVASVGFDGPYGVYHSSYDTLRYAMLFSDPNFVLHRTAAQFYGLLALRLADADVLPYTFGGYIAPLRAATRLVAVRAARTRTDVDVRPLLHAIDRLARQTGAADARVTQAVANPTSELLAVRALNSLVYGANGYQSVTFPSIDAAFVAGDGSGVRDAITRAVGTLTDASAALAH